MNPNPFSSLNHFTTPVAKSQHLLTLDLMREVVLPGTAFPHASSPLCAALTGRIYTSRGYAQPGAWVPPPFPSPLGAGCGGASYFSGSKPLPPLPVSGLAAPLSCGAAAAGAGAAGAAGAAAAGAGVV